jgi:hypothetical protein
MAAMEDERISATRHLQHLKALRQYQLKNRKNALTPTDVKNLMYEVGDGFIDIEMVDQTIAGPSGSTTSSGKASMPSSNHSLTAQSLSWNSHSDSDPDYRP